MVRHSSAAGRGRAASEPSMLTSVSVAMDEKCTQNHRRRSCFADAACRAAFPDFSFTPLADGLARAMREDQSGAAP